MTCKPTVPSTVLKAFVWLWLLQAPCEDGALVLGGCPLSGTRTKNRLETKNTISVRNNLSGTIVGAKKFQTNRGSFFFHVPFHDCEGRTHDQPADLHFGTLDLVGGLYQIGPAGASRRVWCERRRARRPCQAR